MSFPAATLFARFRRAASAPSVIARNDGIAANGSTRKKIELNASTEKRTTGAVLSSFNVSRGFAPSISTA